MKMQWWENEKNIRKLILHHYRRAGIDPDEREFKVILEKNGKRVMVGEYCNIMGTGHKPREIYKLLEKGWKVIGIYSCFRWTWNARRYTGYYDPEAREEDYYGRPYKTVTYVGYSEKADVFLDGTHQQYREKSYVCLETEESKTKYGHIPEKIYDMFMDTKWMDEKDEMS